MNKKFSVRTLGLVGAIVFAIATFFIAFTLSQSTFGGGGASGETLPTVVALTDIPAGQALAPEFLTVVQVPVLGRPTDSFSEISELEGETSRFAVTAGTPITPSILEGNLVGGGDVRLGIGEGERIVSLQLIDPVMGSVVRSGDFVDIGWNSPENDAELILQNVLVVRNTAEDIPSTGGQSNIEPTLLLRLSPQDATALNLANELGTIYVILRTYEDNEVVEETYIEAGQIIGR